MQQVLHAHPPINQGPEEEYAKGMAPHLDRTKPFIPNY